MQENITVLMPAYNAEKYIATAIESVLGQTYRRLELLIIDDGSTDRTANIIKNFKDDRIRLIQNKENLGITATLNLGIKESKYEMIARMDADDICHPWRLEKQVDFMKKNPACAMVCSWVNIIDKDGKYIKTEGIHHNFIYYVLTFECCIFHPTIMFRKECVNAIGVYQQPYAEDYDLFWRLAQRFFISGIDEPLLYYRLHDNNTNLVSKKEEYTQYNLQLIYRNIQHYTGKNQEIEEACIECFRYNFIPLLMNENQKIIQHCLQLLDKISFEIMATENPNSNISDLNYIYRFKRKYILKQITLNLPWRNSIKLLRNEKQINLIPELFFKKIRQFLNTLKG